MRFQDATAIAAPFLLATIALLVIVWLIRGLEQGQADKARAAQARLS